MERTITSGQRFAVNRLIDDFTHDRTERLWIISQLICRKIQTTNELNLHEWHIVRDLAHPNWQENDWSVSIKFQQQIFVLQRKYQEQVLGQQTLSLGENHE